MLCVSSSDTAVIITRLLHYICVNMIATEIRKLLAGDWRWIGIESRSNILEPFQLLFVTVLDCDNHHLNLMSVIWYCTQ